MPMFDHLPASGLHPKRPFRQGIARRAAAAFASASAGSLSIITALCMIPVVGAVAAAVDYARVTADRAAFQSAVDTALIGVVTSGRASYTGLSQAQIADRNAQLTQFATTYITGNYAAAPNVKKSITVALTVTDSNVSIAATHTLPTSLMGFLGVSALTETITSNVTKAPRPVELVMVMDTTGSMAGTAITQAKTAAHTLLNNLYGGTLALKADSPYIRTAMVPFSAAIRLNQSAYDYNSSWIDTTGASSVSRLNFYDPSTGAASTTMHNYLAWTKLKNTPWNGCLEARPGTYATDDTAPTAGDTLFVPYFAPDEPTYSGSANNLPNYYGNSYIGTSGTPNELTGFTTTAEKNTGSSLASDMTSLLKRQNNVNKYTNVAITAEASSGGIGPWFNCVTTPIVPLTYSRSRIETAIDAMTASGSTVIPEGLAWGWKVLSPTEPFTKVEAGPNNAATTISPYHDPHWRKVMVLMTDGGNDVLSAGNPPNPLNGSWYNSYGRVTATTGNRFGTTSPASSSAALDNKMLTLCTNIKAAGIELYTVGYNSTAGAISAAQQANLKACATDANHATVVDPTNIGTVFGNIGLGVVANNIFLSK